MLDKETFLLLNAFLTGGLIKLYDDIKDNNFVTDEQESKSPLMTILKLFIIVLFFIMSMTDPTLLFLSIFIAIPLCLYVGQIDIELWNILIYVSYIALIMNLDKILDNVSKKMMIAIGIGVLILIEAKLFPEEKSKQKTAFRLFFIFLGVSLMYYSRSTPYEFINVVVSFCVGYGISNILFQYFMLPPY